MLPPSRTIRCISPSTRNSRTARPGRAGAWRFRAPIGASSFQSLYLAQALKRHAVAATAGNSLLARFAAHEDAGRNRASRHDSWERGRSGCCRHCLPGAAAFSGITCERTSIWRALASAASSSTRMFTLLDAREMANDLGVDPGDRLRTFPANRSGYAARRSRWPRAAPTRRACDSPARQVCPRVSIELFFDVSIG